MNKYNQGNLNGQGFCIYFQSFVILYLDDNFRVLQSSNKIINTQLKFSNKIIDLELECYNLRILQVLSTSN